MAARLAALTAPFISFSPSFLRLNVQLAVQKYEELFPAFSGSRECTLMKVRAGRLPLPLRLPCLWARAGGVGRGW